jgi:hypothetical protein
MGIWLNELEDAVRREARAALRDRRMLRTTLQECSAAAHEGSRGDTLLLLLQACPRPGVQIPEAEAESLLHAEVARQAQPGYMLRGGQAALLLPGALDAAALKRLLQAMQRRLLKTSQDRLMLGFGAARALEARRGGAASWLALADLRLRSREERLHRSRPASPGVATERRRPSRALPPD